MFRTVVFFIYLVLHTLYTLYNLLIVQLLGVLNMPEQREERIASTARNWGKALIRVSGSKVEVFGAELVPENEAVLFVSNHQSNFDIALMLGFVPKAKGFIAKIELQKVPIASTWMTKMHSLFLDRQNMRQSVKIMREAVEVLKAGHSLVIFPEGTRSKSSRMGEFKRGSLSIAAKANVPIVPVSIVDSYKIMEGNNGIRIKPSTVEIHIMKPVYPADVPPDQELTEMVRSQIQAYLQ